MSSGLATPLVPDASPYAYGPLESLGLADQAHRALRQMILRRVHPPGARLDVHAIAREMGISTAPLRDAVRRLEGEGLVQIHPRRGTFVTEITPEAVHEVFEVRRALELAAAQAAVASLDDGDFAVLEALLDQLRQWLKGDSSLDYDGYLGVDATFHRRIVAAAGNGLLLRLYENLQVHTHVARAKYVRGTHQRWQSLQEHQDILSALRARDKRAVERAVIRHLEVSEADLLTHLRAPADPHLTTSEQSGK